MSDKVEYSRLLLKRSNTAGVTPTIPPVSATTLNQFTPTDLFVGEMFVNVEDDRAWVRTNNSIIEFNFTGGTTGSTVIPTLVQVLNSGNTTGGFDILFPSGSKPVYTGLASGATTQFLGLDVSGNTIIVTGATGGSGTSGTSGTNGSSGISGLGLFLPLSGGTVTGNTTFTQNVYLTNLTSGGSSTYLTVDSDTGQIYTAQGTASTSGTNGSSGTSGVNGTSGTSGVNGTSGTDGSSGINGTSGVNGTSGSSGINGTSGTDGSSGINGTSGTSGVNGTSGTDGSSGINGTSGLNGTSGTDGSSGINGTSGLNGTSGSSGINGTSGTDGSSGINGTSGISGTSGTDGSSGINGSSGTSGVGSSGTSGLSGVNGTSGTSGLPFSGGSGNCITDLYVTNIHGCSPINVADDIIFSGDVFITNITSGGSSTYLTIDSDTGQLYTAQGAAGSSGTSGANGTSGTSGTGGGGGGTNSGSHFNYTTAPGRSYSLTQTGLYNSMDYIGMEERIIAYPMTPGRNLTISGMTIDWYRTYGQTDAKIKFLIYDNNASKFLPNNLLSQSAAITVTQFTILQYNVDYTFSAGTTYWLGIAFNDKMDGTGGNCDGRSYTMTGLMSIGTPTFNDGYGLMWKAAISYTDASLTIPSTWTIPPAIAAFNGSYIWPDEGAYFGGSNPLPEIRIKPKLV